MLPQPKYVCNLAENFSQGSLSNLQESLSKHRGSKRAAVQKHPTILPETWCSFLGLHEFHNSQTDTSADMYETTSFVFLIRD